MVTGNAIKNSWHLMTRSYKLPILGKDLQYLSLLIAGEERDLSQKKQRCILPMQAEQASSHEDLTEDLVAQGILTRLGVQGWHMQVASHIQ